MSKVKNLSKTKVVDKVESGTIYVAVVSASGKPLMPCHPARARELVSNGKAVRRFKTGIFYILLTERTKGKVQPVAAGVDPGSKKEGYTVRSEKRTFLNINCDAVTWVKSKKVTQKQMRTSRRFRKTPCRKNKPNRKCLKNKGMPPSTRSRWGLKVRVLKVLRQLYPISVVVVEDVKAVTRKGKNGKWNKRFSPLQVGKHAFYRWVRKWCRLVTTAGYNTHKLRQLYGVVKTKNKKQEVFSAHCVDSWTLATRALGIRERDLVPDNTRILCLKPLNFYRRQLHMLQPAKKGVRKPYGGTMSLGYKRGSLVKHLKYGIVYVGGTMDNKLSLHCLKTGKRLTQTAKPEDTEFLTYNYFSYKLL
jgi:hypothetical protein